MCLVGENAQVSTCKVAVAAGSPILPQGHAALCGKEAWLDTTDKASPPSPSPHTHRALIMGET